ncbi:MAG: DUF4469 domain-containing protein [Spirochaetaceae bacterium]|jgi:hypothetical protein|nr:DUF4469 domain-containing protein [Spirochaetaceae bacterium]
MAVINNIDEVLHRIRAKLYPNYLHGIPGAFIARADDEASLSIEEVCAALKNRGGFTGSYEDLIEHVRQFLGEAAYQLGDGFSVNLKYFSVHPRIGGTWESAIEKFDPAKHKIGFGFRTLKPLRDLAERVEVLIEGVADTGGFIAEVTDVTTEAVNESLTPGGMFSIAGHKLKIAGSDPACGVYFVSAGAPVQRIPAAGPLGENSASRLIGIIPALTSGQWKIEALTQFTGSGSTLLKSPRTIAWAGEFTVP